MSTVPITAQGYRRLVEELERLKAERPEVIEAISVAREEGDLSENAGYDAARDRQGMLEAKIRDIETRISRLCVIDLAECGGDKACFGATVEIAEIESGATRVWTLLGPDEADPGKGSISVLSPVGRGLLGKVEGDEVVVEAPRGRITYEIISIRFLGSDAPGCPA